MAQRAITGFHLDVENSWVAELACGHRQHVRHDPPFQERPWVVTEVGREARLGALLDCLFCDMPALPQAATVYKRTREFDQETVPKGLLADHKTAPETWGRIVVLEGALLYSLAAPQGQSWVLRPGIPGIIAPTVPHKVKPQGRVRFFVEFLRAT